MTLNVVRSRENTYRFFIRESYQIDSECPGTAFSNGVAAVREDSCLRARNTNSSFFRNYLVFSQYCLISGVWSCAFSCLSTSEAINSDLYRGLPDIAALSQHGMRQSSAEIGRFGFLLRNPSACLDDEKHFFLWVKLLC
jgi:hypothetical protein